jgi:hypothetical protein
MTAMKIINICYDDYANFSYCNAKALQAAGINAKSYKIIKHKFEYREQSEVVDRQQMIEQIKKADLVQIMHSDLNALYFCTLAGQKNIVVYHTGSNYRREPEVMNAKFNPNVVGCFTDQCEFIGTGMKNEKYIATAIDFESLQDKRYQWETNDPYTIGHYPSNAEVKGTKEIIALLFGVDQTKFHFKHTTEKAGHNTNLLRMSQCDIYIELFKPFLDGKKYGCFGVTGFEAAAMGKVVVTQNLNPEAYEKEYGAPAFFLANDQRQFIDIVADLLNQSPENIKKLQDQAREWIRSKHSYEATGKHLRAIYNI